MEHSFYMKPMNRAERWYVYVLLYHDFTDRIDILFPYSITKAGRAIREDTMRHEELQKYSSYLIHEAPK